MEICLFCGNRLMRREPCQCFEAKLDREMALWPELSFDNVGPDDLIESHRKYEPLPQCIEGEGAICIYCRGDGCWVCDW